MPPPNLFDLKRSTNRLNLQQKVCKSSITVFMLTKNIDKTPGLVLFISHWSSNTESKASDESHLRYHNHHHHHYNIIMLMVLVWSFSNCRHSAGDGLAALVGREHKKSTKLSWHYNIELHVWPSSISVHVHVQCKYKKKHKYGCKWEGPDTLLCFLSHKLPVRRNWVKLLTSTMLIETVWADYWKNDKVLHN